MTEYQSPAGMNFKPGLKRQDDMLTLVLAEAALECIPRKLQDHNSVLSHAGRLHKDPSEILLDNSWHYAAMRGIKDEIKRGRPDLVHASILAATAIPLYQNNRIRIYVHTIGDHVIRLGAGTNIPRSYHRFAGLVEKLFREEVIQSGQRTLLEMHRETLPELIDGLEPSSVVGLSTRGKPSSFEHVASILDEHACVLIGGFQKGHFSETTQGKIESMYSVGDMSYDAHVVISRLAYEYEKTIFM